MGPTHTPVDPKASSIGDKLSPSMIRSQMDRILSSEDFKATDAQRAFFKFVVEKALAGKSHEIKGYNVATQVFGRKANFDQTTDPIVSIQANKLRRALELYSLKAGKQDPVRIDIPKGTYIPKFLSQSSVELKTHSYTHEALKTNNENAQPVLLVRPFQNLSGIPEFDFWGIGLASELTSELARYPDVQVFPYHSTQPDHQERYRASRFTIDGNVRTDQESIKVTVQMTDTETGLQIWGDSIRSEISAAKLIDYQEEIARRVAVITAGEQGVIIKTLSKHYNRKRPKQNKAYEAMLRYYEYDLKLTLKSFTEAFAALKNAVKIEPDCGQVWCMLARLYADIHSLDQPGYTHALEKAVEYALKGIRLAPDDQRSRAIMAYIHLLRNDLAGGLAEANQAIELSPNTLFVQDGIGYLLTLLGDWERGTAMIRNIIRINPYYGNYVHHALWLDCIRQKDYKKSYLETLKLNRPSLFWDHLVRAASLGLTGKVDDGCKSAVELLKLKPDFPQRGNTIIRHYIKFDEMVSRTIEGLNKVGVIID